MSLTKRCVAECLGTFWLVFGGTGAAVLAAAYPNLGIGFMEVAFAFGLTLLTMAYAVGQISGAHFNPAVSCGLAAARRFPGSELPAYIIAQVVGGFIGSAVLYLIAMGKPGFNLSLGLAANGYGEHSPGGYSLGSVVILELVLTFMFVLIILGATERRVPAGFAPIPIGLALMVVNLIGIPVSNCSVNPARSTAPALFVGGWAAQQLWVFWLAPIVGAIIAGLVYPLLTEEIPTHVPIPHPGEV